MKTAIAVALAGVALTLTACNRSSSIEPTATPAAQAAFGGLSAAPAPAERGPFAGDAIAKEAGTETGDVFANVKTSAALPPSKGGSPQAQVVNVRAQEAAAKAPDTASADAAKKKVQRADANVAAA